jgi:hypothetical protein
LAAAIFSARRDPRWFTVKSVEQGITHLLVVASDEPYLLGKVRSTFGDLATVRVVRDRRRSERRTMQAEPPGQERRVGERRSFDVGAQLSRFGWVLIPIRQSVSV